MKTPKLEAGHVAHRALLAHATDLTLIGTSLRPHAGFSEADAPERVITAVTTHTVWFHRAVRIDDWWGLVQASPIMDGARAFGRGEVFDAAGGLVASYAQESLVRPVV
jgi:acyl-CoA thioesterase-2